VVLCAAHHLPSIPLKRSVRASAGPPTRWTPSLRAASASRSG